MKEIRKLMQRFSVPPGRKVRLKKYDPDWTGSVKDATKAKTMLLDGVKRLSKQQALLYAQDTYSVLVIFQAMMRLTRAIIRLLPERAASTAQTPARSRFPG